MNGSRRFGIHTISSGVPFPADIIMAARKSAGGDTARGRAIETPTDIEGLGVFYLGRKVDTSGGSAGGSLGGQPLLIDARRFTTHAVCVGMTGSGKTGLLIDLIEEAAIDGIPTLVIDPKGDLANVLLSFPGLAPADFLPWVEADAAKRDGITVEELAERTAKKWSDGLAASGQSAERIRRLHESVDMAVYTPGSRTGRPLAMLESLDPPPAHVLDDAEARQARCGSFMRHSRFRKQKGQHREEKAFSSVLRAVVAEAERSRGLF